MSVADVHNEIPVELYLQNYIDIGRNTKRMLVIMASFSWVSVISLRRILLSRIQLNLLNSNINLHL